MTLGQHGAFGALGHGAIFVDHTTASATIARELHDAAKDRGAGALDAPVSGGQSGAENGTLTVMVGGDEADFAKAKPVIEAYARAVNLIGPSGSGQLTKMVNQICIGGLIEGLAEALHFARRAGLDIEKVIDTISKGAAQSWQMDNRWQTMIDGKFEFGFAVDWVRKDFALVLRGSAAQRRRASRDGPGRSVLRRDPGHGRRPLGHLQPDRASRTQRVRVLRPSSLPPRIRAAAPW